MDSVIFPLPAGKRTGSIRPEVLFTSNNDNIILGSKGIAFNYSGNLFKEEDI